MIRPLDLQVNTMQTPSVSKIEQDNQTRMTSDQAQFANQMQKQITEDNQNVIQTNKTEQNAVDENGKNSSEQQRKRKKQEKRNDEKATDVKNVKNSTSMFDVKI